MTTANIVVRKILPGRGNTAVSATYTGIVGEVTVDTGLDTLRVHDGVTPGGTRLATYDELANVALGNIDLSGYATTAQITAANANAAVQAVAINALNANIGAFHAYANATFTGGGAGTYSNTNVVAYLTTVAGNIVPAANVTYSLGTATRQWKDLWVSNNTIYIGNVPITVSNGSLLINGNVITGGSTYSNTNVAAYLVANPQSGTYSNTNVIAYLGDFYTYANGTYSTVSNAAAAHSEINGLRANITAANSAITTANTGMKSYVDAVTTAWTANAGTQATDINGLRANITAANVAWTSNAATQATAISSLQGNANKLVNGSYQLTLDSQGVVNVPISQYNTGQVFAPINYSLFLGTSSKFIQVRGSDGAIIFADYTAQTTAYPGTSILNSVNANITAANSAISGLHANITAANTAIASLQAQTYSNVNTAAYLAGNVTTGNLTVATDAVVLGNLRVQGTQTTVNTATLNVTDLYITVANAATQASDANGAGIRVAGALANIAYSSVSDSFVFNKPIQANLVAGNIVFADGTYQTTSWYANIGAFQTYANSTFLTAEADTLDSVTTRGNTTTNNITVGNVTTGNIISGTYAWQFGATGNLTVPGNFLPTTDNTQDLGSATMRFRHLYVGPGTVYVGNAAIKTTAAGNLILPGITRAVASSAYAEEVEDTGDQTHSFTTVPTLIDNAYYSYLNGDPFGLTFTAAEYSVDQLDGEGLIDGITIDSRGSGYSDTVASLAEQGMWATEAADPVNNFTPSDWIQIPFRVRSRAGESEFEFSTGTNLGDFNITGSTLESNGSDNFVNMDVDGDGWMRLGTYYNQKLQLITDWDGNTNIWEFAANGVLTLPVGGDILNSNGASVLGGGGGGASDRLTSNGNEIVMQANGALSFPFSNGVITSGEGDMVLSAPGGVSLNNYDGENSTAQFGLYSQTINFSTNHAQLSLNNQGLVLDSGAVIGNDPSPETITLTGAQHEASNGTYTRTDYNVYPPTWYKDADPGSNQYIRFQNGGWVAFESEINSDNPIYTNDGTNRAPDDQWDLGYSSAPAPTSTHGYSSNKWHFTNSGKLYVPGDGDVSISNDGEFRLWTKDVGITVYRNGRDGYGVFENEVRVFADNDQITSTTPDGFEIIQGNLVIPTDKGIFYANGTAYSTGGGGGGTVAPVIVGNVAEGTEGSLWYNTTDGRLYVDIDNNGDLTWVDASPTVAPPPSYYLGNLEVDGDTINFTNGNLTIDSTGNLLVNGNLVTGSGGGTPTDVYDPNGDVTIQTQSATWTFNACNTLSWPSNNLTISTYGANTSWGSSGGTTFTTATGFTFNANTGMAQWQMDVHGNLILPTGGFINYANGVNILSNVSGGNANTGDITFSGSDIVGAGNEVVLTADTTDYTFYSNANLVLPANATVASIGKLQLVTGLSVDNWTWDFGANGNLVIPYGSLTLDSGYETGIAGFIAPTGGVALGSTMLYNSGNIASQILQNRPGFGEPVQISTYQDNSNPAATWTFDANGNLTLPNGGQLGSIETTDSVDLYGNSGSQYVQINWNNQNFVYVDSTGAHMQAGPTAPGEYEIFLSTDGSTTFPDHMPVSITGNLTVGNLIVNGNTTTINTQSYTVSDNIVQFAADNPADTLDIGFVGHRTVNSTLQHTGLVRDASTGLWKLFSNVTAQPGTTVDFSTAIFDDLQLDKLYADTIHLTGTAPITAQGASGDLEGDIHVDADYLYYCIADWTNTAGPWTTTLTADKNPGDFFKIQIAKSSVYGTPTGDTFNNQGTAWLVSLNGVSTYVDMPAIDAGTDWILDLNSTPSVFGTGDVVVLTNPVASQPSIWKSIPLNTYRTAVTGTYSNTNVAAYLTSQNVTSANIGAYQTYANTQIQTLNANIGAFHTYANATFGASSYGNTQVAAYLTGNITTGNVTATQYNFANGVNILSTVGAGSYANTDVAGYLAANTALYFGNPVTRPTLQANNTQVFIGNTTVIAQGGASSLGSTYIMNNAYYNTAGVLTARNTSASGSGQMEIAGGTFNWNGASSATAGSAAGMGARMSLSSTALATQNSIGITSAGTLTVQGASGLVTTQSTGALFNTTATTINLGGAATTINMGASTVAVSVGSGTGTVTTGSLNATNLYTANAVIAGGYISGTANIAITSSGNISGVGNIIGATSNTTVTAGAYVTSFLSNGVVAVANVVASGNVTAAYYAGSGSQLTGVATTVTGSWTLSAGSNAVSLTVPGPGTYALWVNGNIPNGICTYTATVVVTNTNVPVLGSQYAWYYAAGNMLVITSIPGQIVGTANSIITTAPSTTTANVFEFGITNNSGASCTVNYGYTKLS